MTYTYYDTETCGFHGPIVLFQYLQCEDRRAAKNGEIKLYSPWHNPIHQTLELYKRVIADSNIIAFNNTFDMFHVCQQYTTLMLLQCETGPHGYPVDHVEQYALMEPVARNGPCIKPISTLDLMLHARKGPYQSTMDREDIRIKRIPRVLAEELIDELNTRVPFKDVYFARLSNPKQRWKQYEILDDLGDPHPDLVDLCLKFAPSSGLKALAGDALGVEDVIKFNAIELDPMYRPKEHGFAPFALSVGKPGNWNGAWPQVIYEHFTHWGYNEQARLYAAKDVEYLYRLDEYFSFPAMGDDDSELSSMVGAIRWHGYKVDTKMLMGLKLRAEKAKARVSHKTGLMKGSPINFNSQDVTRKYLTAVLSTTEQVVMSQNDKITTKAIILEEIAKWKVEDVCSACGGLGCLLCRDGMVETIGDYECIDCDGHGTLGEYELEGITTDIPCPECKGAKVLKGPIPHEAARRAKHVLNYRHAGKEIELLDKLLLAGRMHASLKIIGALSGRMSGGDGMNVQGIKRTEEFRKCFPLAFEGYQLRGGDFSGFEVTIADAVYNDPELRADLMTMRPCTKCLKRGSISATCSECNGSGLESTKIHALFGQYLFPPMDYDQIYATKGLPGDKDKYGRSKNCVFALLYGGESYTLSTRGGIPEDVAQAAYNGWVSKYVVWGEARKAITELFCTMKQAGGLGTKVEWNNPADYIETLLGFKRYFTLENRICKALYDIANEPPKEWAKIKLKVVRREKEQTVSGAIRSALYGAAFGIQAGNMRAAANHTVQGTGAAMTKTLQRRFWDIQPSGVSPFLLLPLNVHDEIMCPSIKAIEMKLDKIRETYIKEMKSLVPLLAIDWSNEMRTWSDK